MKKDTKTIYIFHEDKNKEEIKLEHLCKNMTSLKALIRDKFFDKMEKENNSEFTNIKDILIGRDSIIVVFSQWEEEITFHGYSFSKINVI